MRRKPEEVNNEYGDMYSTVYLFMSNGLGKQTYKSMLYRKNLRVNLSILHQDSNNCKNCLFINTAQVEPFSEKRLLVREHA